MWMSVRWATESHSSSLRRSDRQPPWILSNGRNFTLRSARNGIFPLRVWHVTRRSRTNLEAARRHFLVRFLVLKNLNICFLGVSCGCYVVTNWLLIKSEIKHLIFLFCIPVIRILIFDLAWPRHQVNEVRLSSRVLILLNFISDRGLISF